MSFSIHQRPTRLCVVLMLLPAIVLLGLLSHYGPKNISVTLTSKRLCCGEFQFDANKLRVLRNAARNISDIIRKPARIFTPFLNVTVIHPHKPSGENLSYSYIQRAINDGYTVPNAAHFVLPFYQPQLEFHHMVCMLSAFWIMRPLKFFVWYNELPSGEYWEYFKANVTDYNERVILVYRPRPYNVYGIPLKKKEHASDIVRKEALLLFGGAYFDIDVITLRQLEPLRGYGFTIGRESGGALCNGIMLSEPSSLFLMLWTLMYQSFHRNQWAYHSVIIPNMMLRHWRHLVHVEEDSLDRPNWMPHERKWIYEKQRRWKWQEKNYAMHLWYRFHRVQYDFESVKFVDSMLGDMFRMVLYGNPMIHVNTSHY